MIYKQDKLVIFSSILLCLIPLALISGPFIPDLFLVIININFIIYLYSNKNYEVIKNKYLIILLFCCLVLTLVSIFSLNLSSVKSSLFYFRFGVFSLATYVLINLEKNVLNYILNIFLVIYIILFIDSIYQFNFSENLIGLKYINKQNFRVTSFFGDDEVLGSYTARFFPLILFLIVYKYENFVKIKNIIISLVLTISFIIVLLSGERTAVALFILSICFIFFSSIKIRKLMMFPLILCLVLFGIIISSNEKIKNRIITTTYNQLGFSSESERLVLFSKIYEGHYIISLNMFKEKPIFGHGAKMFRFYCDKEENFVAGNACSTHPHNFYAQMLAEVGIFGFTVLISIFCYILFLFFKNFYYQVFKKKQLIKDEAICLLSCYFITLFPLLPSGNFFNNWLSLIIYYPLGFLIYIIKKNKFYV
tara:strand:+ start:341 stop:1603 length:1263 start_codon:yes stop_codon:yes gene_type:complete